MVNARRAARELALKVLFQVDVGKQPIAEVMEGALEQVRQTVDHPVSQHFHELQAEQKRLIEERRPELSTQSLRQVRNVARSLVTTMRSLTQQISDRTEMMLAHPRDHTPNSVGDLIHDEVAQAQELMARASARETLQPQLVATLVEDASRRAGLTEHAFGRNAAQAHATAAFVHTLVDGVQEKRKDIDRKVAALSEGWALDRQPAVDRNILRIAAFELLFLPDVPAGASINEAVELAKKFSTAEFGRFINGVLGTLASSVGRDAELAAATRSDTAVEEGSTE